MELQIKSHRAWLTIIGGAIALVLAPIMVIIKYMTGWDIIAQPGWVEPVKTAFAPLFSFAPPTELWSIYGSAYSFTLLLMISGFIVLWTTIRAKANKWLKAGYWIMLSGLLMVLVGDFVHSITWHRPGISVPTPGSYPLANNAYALGMMGMNFILIGSLIFGITALRGRYLPKWLAWMFICITPSAPLLSTTLLPTTPSGGLLFFAIISLLLGRHLLQQQRNLAVR